VLGSRFGFFVSSGVRSFNANGLGTKIELSVGSNILVPTVEVARPPEESANVAMQQPNPAQSASDNSFAFAHVGDLRSVLDEPSEEPHIATHNTCEVDTISFFASELLAVSVSGEISKCADGEPREKPLVEPSICLVTIPSSEQRLKHISSVSTVVEPGYKANSPWERRWDVRKNRFYYANVNLRQTSWQVCSLRV
jgi:hypothetical protein